MHLAYRVLWSFWPVPLTLRCRIGGLRHWFSSKWVKTTLVGLHLFIIVLCRNLWLCTSHFKATTIYNLNSIIKARQETIIQQWQAARTAKVVLTSVSEVNVLFYCIFKNVVYIKYLGWMHRECLLSGTKGNINNLYLCRKTSSTQMYIMLNNGAYPLCTVPVFEEAPEAKSHQLQRRLNNKSGGEEVVAVLQCSLQRLQ